MPPLVNTTSPGAAPDDLGQDRSRRVELGPGLAGQGVGSRRVAVALGQQGNERVDGLGPGRGAGRVVEEVPLHGPQSRTPARPAPRPHWSPVDGYDASTYGDRFADVYDDWYGDVTDAVACTAKVAELARAAGGGPVLELGVGSGRLALPLVERGLEVHGIDASPAMVERLRAKPGGDRVRVTIGDMADLDLPAAPPFSVVLVAFNTFFNLATEAAQRRCLERVDGRARPGRLVRARGVRARGGRGAPASTARSRPATSRPTRWSCR